jgi:membrane fusion protein (multidrug efflux system)
VPLQSQLVAQTRSPQSVVIYTRVSGFLEKQVYQEGSWVNAGDILFEMDKRPFITQLDAAKAALVAQEAALRTATLTLNRIKPLAAAKALSQQDLDNATGNFLRAQAGVDQARANVETAQLNLEYCTIRSPISGLASVRKQALGTYLAVGSQDSELTVVNQMDPMWVYFSVSEDQVLSLNKLLAEKQLNDTSLAELDVTLTLSNGTLYPYVGKIGFAGIMFDVETGTRLYRAVFPNPGNSLQQGQFVTVSVVGLEQPNVYLVPQAAVQQSSQGAYVWVVDEESRVHSRTVVPGYWNGPNWIINGGLNPGERVVVSNVLRMSPNQLVKPSLTKTPEPQLIRMPTPPTDTPTPSPYGPGAQLPATINQAQNPKQLPMPVAPPPAAKLIAPTETPISSGVPMAPSSVPNSLKAPAAGAAQ